MTCSVVLTPKALERLWAAARWYASKSGSMQFAVEWHDGFIAAVQSLESNPDRCSLAAENDELPFEVREFYYGSGRRKTHRDLFRVRESIVEVLTIRHFAERPVTADDL